MKVKRRLILISVSRPTYMLARDLALPKNLEETNFEEILHLLDRHFEPKRLEFVEDQLSTWLYHDLTKVTLNGRLKLGDWQHTVGLRTWRKLFLIN